MKHKLLVGCLALVTLVVIGATTMRISDYPNRVTPAATDMFLLASTIDHTNYYTTWAQLSAAIGVVSNGLAGTNLYITNIYAGDVITTNITIISNLFNDTGNFTNVIADSGWFNHLYATQLFAYAIYSPVGYFTNLYAGTLFSSTNYLGDVTITNGLTNLFLTPDTVVKSDANRALASIPNGEGVLTNDGTGVFGWMTITNFTVPDLVVQSNLFIDKTVTFTNNIMVLSNGMVFAEYAWLGPTNQITTVPLKNSIINRYQYSTGTDCAITNFTPWTTNGFVQHVVVEIKNISGSNVNITVHEPIRIPVEDTSRTYVLTNGNLMICSLEWAPLGTNSVLRQFK